MNDDIRDVEIDAEPIELCKLLKFEGLVESGGDAKVVVADGAVRVNGEVEIRKRKKIYFGDIVEFEEERIRVIPAATPK